MCVLFFKMLHVPPALAEAHPTTLCICLVIEKHCDWHSAIIVWYKAMVATSLYAYNLCFIVNILFV